MQLHIPENYALYLSSSFSLVYLVKNTNAVVSIVQPPFILNKCPLQFYLILFTDTVHLETATSLYQCGVSVISSG